jgi:hypothetical protein
MLNRPHRSAAMAPRARLCTIDLDAVVFHDSLTSASGLATKRITAVDLRPEPNNLACG